MIMAFFPVVMALFVGAVATVFSYGVAFCLNCLLHIVMGVK